MRRAGWLVVTLASTKKAMKKIVKKISRQQWEKIFHRNAARGFAHSLCDCYLIYDSTHGLIAKQKIGWLLFILEWPLCVVIDFFICLWDGGLKEFSFPRRTLEVIGYVPFDDKLMEIVNDEKWSAAIMAELESN